MPPRTGHPYYMHDAIFAQPGALRLVGRGNDAALDATAAKAREAARVVLAGIGSSWHAALFGERLLAQAGGLGARVRAMSAFELAAYGPAPDAATVTIVVSHGGGSRYVREALDAAKRAGGTAIALTGKGHEALRAADHVLRTIEPEASSTHTVSYTTALALLVSLAIRLGAAGLAHELGEIPDHVATLLGQESWDDMAARYAGRRRYWVLGGGPNVATAHEIALKMSEAAHVTALGFEVEQFLHGAWAAVETDDLVVVVAPPGPTHARALMAARVAREIGAAVLMLAEESDREAAAAASETIAIPPTPERLSPIVAVVPLQLLTYHLALARGVNPDTMRTHEPAYGRARGAMSL
ncbi:MAG: SIS domain-containing protein [Candidatus Rokubacteria bacterium]|nr:SIS domain-containing protein [Candidatus Rokubacteria bacterium]